MKVIKLKINSEPIDFKDCYLLTNPAPEIKIIYNSLSDDLRSCILDSLVNGLMIQFKGVCNDGFEASVVVGCINESTKEITLNFSGPVEIISGSL